MLPVVLKMHLPLAATLCATPLGVVAFQLQLDLPLGWRVHQSGGTLSTLDQRCANRSTAQWKVGAEHGSAYIVPHDLHEPRRQPPEWPPWLRRRRPDRAVRLGDGWLFAVDRGEFPGGGLWWANGSGERLRELLPHNVQNLRGTSEDGALVFAGVAHGHDEGAVFAIHHEGDRLRTKFLGRLDGAAGAVSEAGEPFVVATLSGVWEAWTDRPPVRVSAFDLRLLIPRSVVKLPNGTIYVGLSAFVLRLLPAPGGYETEWLLPNTCRRFELDETGCVCR